MSLFGDLSVGTSGLKAGQYGLNVVAHNLANVDTEGYVRQQMVYDSSPYLLIGQTSVSPMQVGLGVDPAQVRQVRDVFLDKAYRQEAGRQGYYEAQRDAVSEIEDLFGELQGVAFQDTLKDFWVSLQELSKEPDSRVAQATFVETGINFVERSDKIYKQLKEFQLNLNTNIREKITRINEIGDRIFELNRKIVFYESSEVENANDYRDERNHLLDELGTMVKIDYKEQIDGRVTIAIEGSTFLSEDFCYHMDYLTMAQYREKQGIEIPLDEAADILIPIWPHLGGAEVFDWSQVPSTPANSDIGSLKGSLQARGTRIGKYTDIPIEPKIEDYTDEEGDVDEEEYKRALDIFEEATRDYNLNIESSIMMRTQAQFDQLIHGVVTIINDTLCPDREVTIAAGTTITLNDGSTYTYEDDTKIRIFDEEHAPVGVDEFATPGEELFSRKTVRRYMDPQDITLSDGTVLENVRIYNAENADDNYSLYTLGEIEVNAAIVENKSKLPVINASGTGDYDMDMIKRLLSRWQEPFATLDPNALTYNNVTNYYTQFIGEIATKGDEYNILANNQECMTNAVNDRRLAKTAVSSDEELTYLIRYQHAYNASARYIGVIDEMLEHLILKLA
ncbi:MAG: flagellar hook-associated protein FlgK [Lachnospiraceae bacterium]|nr:flagellar hook-associated protein FlgK [Lachnospiraceae bacterium]